MCHIIPPCSSSHRIANDERTGYIPLLRSLTDTVCTRVLLYHYIRSPVVCISSGMYIMLRPDCIYYPSSSMGSKIIDMFLLRALFRQMIHGS